MEFLNQKKSKQMTNLSETVASLKVKRNAIEAKIAHIEMTNLSETVASLKVKRDAIEAKIAHIEQRLAHENTLTLIQEVLNLLDGVGEGYTDRDYMGPSRYYSEIPGVKNIRMLRLSDCVLVKVNNDSGYLVPESITVRGETFKIEFDEASNYNGECSY